MYTLCHITINNFSITSKGSTCGSVLSYQLGCAQNDSWTPKLASYIYAGLSFASFLTNLPGLLLIVFQFCKNNSIERPEKLFFLASVVLTLFSFVESFQWIFAFSEEPSGKIACQVLGVFREYCGVMLLVLIGCVGFHLILLRQNFKCLMVIDEVKNTRYNKLIISYCAMIFLLPLLLVPWPWINLKNNESYHYGASEYACWISLYDQNGNCSTLDYFVEGFTLQIVLFYFWVFVIAVFLAFAILRVTLTICCQKSRQCTINHCSLLSVTAIVLIAVMIIESLFAVNVLYRNRKVPYVQIYATVVCIPLFVMLISSVLLARICYVRLVRRQHYAATQNVRREVNAPFPDETEPLLTTSTTFSDK